MDQVFRCPVVGMCLSVKEQRLLCRKVGAGIQVKSDFGIHEMIVATMNGENPLSRKLENMLIKKYEASCSIYLDMAEADFLDCWHRALESGDYNNQNKEGNTALHEATLGEDDPSTARSAILSVIPPDCLYPRSSPS